MRRMALVCIAAMLGPASLRAQPEPQPVCPLECNCTVGTSVVRVLGFGVQDNFAPPSEPTAFPTSPIAATLVRCGDGLLNFDNIAGENGAPANAWFADELTDAFFICDARVEVHARATTGTGSNGTSDDHVYLIQTGDACPVPFAWSALLRDLPEANGQWIPGQDATFCLDLDALPVPGGTFNALYSIQNGRIEIVVGDNSGVDSVILSLCEEPDAVSPSDWSNVKRLYR